MSKITYTDKEYIYKNAEIPEINKITDENMNEIKSVVNENDTRLTTAEGEIDTAQTDINNAEAVIGNETDTYSASSTYALGSLVIYEGLLYKCTTAITVAEAWTIAHWTQVSLTSLANDGDVYSTSEQIIGTWNGKPLYRKTLVLGTAIDCIANSWTTVISDISSLNILININSLLIASNNWAWNGYLLRRNNNNLDVFNTGTTWGVKTIVLEYTKTTD